MSSCGEITDEDIIDFVMADTSYPFSKLLPEFQDGILDPRNQVDALAIRAFVKKKLMAKGIQARLECMQLHDMFK